MSKKWIYKTNVIITGASSGIGKELVKTFITKFNCKVLGVSRNEERAKKFADELNSPAYSYYCFDVGVESNWVDFANHLKDADFAPDIIINNAGVLPTFRSFSNTDLDTVKETFQIDFWSAIYSVKYLDGLLNKSKKPAIINVSSSSALASLVGTTSYTSAKTALRAFTECYSEEQRGKRYVAVVCPGFTKTDIFKSQKQSIEDGIVGKISTPVTKMTKKIVRGIQKKKKRMVLGKDARIMNFLYKICPKKSTSLFAYVMKKSGLELFKEIFNENDL